MSDATNASPFCHIVIPAADLAKAKAFYETVFGWRVESNNPGPNYWFFQSGNVGGGFDRSAKAAAGGMVLVIEVDAMEPTLQRIAEQGGTITRGRSAIGEASAGYDAYFRDPNGNDMGVYSAR